MLNEQAGTVYLAPVADSDGRPLEPGKTYKLNVPANTPARQFWSLTVYDYANWALIPNPTARSGLSSFNKERMNVNNDGSVDLYFGPEAPSGLESNWIPTMGKKPYVWFRLYGPDTAFWDKSFKLPDPVLLLN